MPDSCLRDRFANAERACRICQLCSLISKPRVADEVDEEDVTDLKFQIDRFSSLRIHGLGAVFGMTPMFCAKVMKRGSSL
jgi:hypothetical protein